jgi:hypothetical protein
MALHPAPLTSGDPSTQHCHPGLSKPFHQAPAKRPGGTAKKNHRYSSPPEARRLDSRYSLALRERSLVRPSGEHALNVDEIVTPGCGSLSINVLYPLDDAGKRAVGFKLSDGMEAPAELAEKLKFARQMSKLAGTIRGSYFVFKSEY